MGGGDSRENDQQVRRPAADRLRAQGTGRRLLRRVRILLFLQHRMSDRSAQEVLLQLQLQGVLRFVCLELTLPPSARRTNTRPARTVPLRYAAGVRLPA